MKILFFDLDNTLLDKDKRVSEENLEAIRLAQSQGVVPVVSTGRYYSVIPECVRRELRYFITINGAKVFDSDSGQIIYESTITPSQALKIYDYADNLDCIYDAYINDNGYMSQNMYELIDQYQQDPAYRAMMKKMRVPVFDLKQMIADNQFPVQKIQLHFKKTEDREQQLIFLGNTMSEFKLSYSLGSNLEINSVNADKGLALEAICSYMGIPVKESVAFGDGLNDIEMLKKAGISYCMINGDDRVKAISDRITEYDCNSSGVGREIIKLLNT